MLLSHQNLATTAVDACGRMYVTRRDGKRGSFGQRQSAIRAPAEHPKLPELSHLQRQRPALIPQRNTTRLDLRLSKTCWAPRRLRVRRPAGLGTAAEAGLPQEMDDPCPTQRTIVCSDSLLAEECRQAVSSCLGKGPELGWVISVPLAPWMSAR